jgi:hypothetical protein
MGIQIAGSPLGYVSLYGLFSMSQIGYEKI